MEDLLIALDAKERELMQFMEDSAKQHSAMRGQLEDMTQRMLGAEEDLRRIHRARNALQHPSNEKMDLDDPPATRPSSGRAVAPSYGSR